jgi:drug/metabolite transporter (DMT)-like permease
MAAVLLFVGVFACSTAVIFIKKSALDPALLAGLRQLLAAVLLLPLFLRAKRRHAGVWRWADARRCVMPGIALAAYFTAWVIGGRATLAANATLIVNMVPLATPFFLAVLAGERMKRAELAGTAIGLCGVLLLSAGDFRAERATLVGDAICFASMLLFAWYLALGRKNRDIRSLWLYVVPLYAIGGVLCVLIGLVHAGGVGEWSAREVVWVFGLAVGPTVIGHSLLNLALKQLPGATVSVGNLGQFLFAAFMGWALFGEVPKPIFWPASALIVAGALIAVWGPVVRVRATVLSTRK